MTAILHMSGPAFLLLYCVLFAGALILGRGIRDSLRHSHQAHRLRDPCHPHELAYLSQGRGLAIATALVRLAGRGYLELAPSGTEIHLKAKLDRNAHALEKAIYHAFEINPVFSTLDLSKDIFSESVKELQDRGFLSDPESPENRHVQWWGSLPLGLLILLGLAKLWVGISNDRPVIFLLVLLAISLFVFVCKLSEIERTPLGKDFIEYQTRRNAALRPTGSPHSQPLSEADLLLSVALFGTKALEQTPLDWLRRTGLFHDPADPVTHKNSGSGSGGGDSSSGDGSSGDGGGGCGGGCGGCGGD